MAFVGLVGSGKTTIAKELARYIGGTVVSSDAIRVILRKRKGDYADVRDIAVAAAAEVIQRGGNAILESDHVDAKKRRTLERTAKMVGARVFYVRVCTNLDVMLGRVLKDREPDPFFAGASSLWQGREKPKVIKLRELIRRLPHHYRWESKNSGAWFARALPIPFVATLNASDDHTWRDQVKKLAARIG